MFKTERVPVTVYQSTDEGAPQLTADAGSLKTILKACLVSGYGSRQALGWEAAFEDSSYIALRSRHNKASKCWISIDNQYPRAVEVAGYHEMSAKNTGEKKFGEGLVKLLPLNSNGAPWLLVGHERGFCLLVNSAMYNPNHVSQPIYFGDFNGIAPVENRNCVLIKNGSPLGSGEKYINNHREGLGSEIKVTNWRFPEKYLMALASSADQVLHDVSSTVASAGQYYANATYPDFVSGGFSAFEMFILEGAYNANSWQAHLRGLLGGMMMIREKMPTIADFTFFDNLDGRGDRFVKFCTNDYTRGGDCFLLNCTAWEI